MEFFRRRLLQAVTLLPLLATAPVAANAGAGTASATDAADAYQLGRQRLERFAALNPHLDGKDAEAERALSRECPALEARCLRYLQRHAAAARRAVADNPAYWEAYRALLETSPASRHVEDLENYRFQELISATRDWPMHVLLSQGRLQAPEVHFQLAAHRRMLAESGFLIDKMIFTATVSIAMAPVNVLMAQLGAEATAEQTRLLNEMLKPLSVDELSLRAAMQGEHRHMLAIRERSTEYPELDDTTLTDVARTHLYIADQSELDWDTYWREGLDVLSDVPDLPHFEYVPQWADYITNTRMLDAQLYVLRALREMYAGRVTPGVPASPPPAFWRWRWKGDELCLEPGYVHPSLGEPRAMCVAYLEVEVE